MSDVVALPTAAPHPLPKTRWYGPYPKGVSPLAKQRLRRKHKASEDAIEASQHTEDARSATVEVLSVLLDKAHRGLVGGLLVMHEESNGHQSLLATGVFRDLVHAKEAAELAADALEGAAR